MKLKYFIIPLLFLILLFVGCANGRIIIEKNPTSKPYPAEPHVKKGPPPWAPAHGHRAKYRYQYYPSTSVYFDVEGYIFTLNMASGVYQPRFLPGFQLRSTILYI